jgi:hypothetical protein
LLPPGTAPGNTTYWNGSSWVVNSSNIYNDGGNVGVNTTTPGYTFDVNGTAHAASAFVVGSFGGQLYNDQGSSLELGSNNGTASPSGAAPYIDFHYGTGVAQDFNVRLSNTANQRLSVVSNGNTLNFTSGWQGTPDPTTNVAEISNDTGIYQTLMIVGNKSAGAGRHVSVWDNLGVATPSPQQALSVNSGLNIDQANADTGSLAAGPNSALTFGSGSGEGIGSQRSGSPGQLGLDFYTGFAKRMSISNGGFVGIGTNTPAFPLDVQTTLGTAISNYGYLNNTNPVPVGFNGGTSGNNPYSARFAGRLVAPEYDAISDMREKHVLDHMDPEVALGALRGVDVVRYEWLYRGGLPRWGVIAQQLGPHIPEAVSIQAGTINGQRVDDFHTVDFQQVTAVELAAIQALDARTEALFTPAPEAVPLDDAVEAGDVVCAEPSLPGRAAPCTTPEAPVLGVTTEDGLLASSGRVRVKVALEHGEIRPGDLLAPSPTPGVAMRASASTRAVGVALEAVDRGDGTAMVLCLVKTGASGLASLVLETSSLRASNAALESQSSVLAAKVRALEAENASMHARLSRIEEAMGRLVDRAPTDRTR